MDLLNKNEKPPVEYIEFNKLKNKHELESLNEKFIMEVELHRFYKVSTYIML